jgi:hypothetical protein
VPPRFWPASSRSGSGSRRSFPHAPRPWLFRQLCQWPFWTSGKSAAGAERVTRAGARLSPTLGWRGRQLAAGIGGQVPAHRFSRVLEHSSAALRAGGQSAPLNRLAQRDMSDRRARCPTQTAGVSNAPRSGRKVSRSTPGVRTTAWPVPPVFFAIGPLLASRNGQYSFVGAAQRRRDPRQLRCSSPCRSLPQPGFGVVVM